jgi:hypothetical protein
MLIKPEMKSSLIDESHWKFHVECKAKVVNAVNKLRKGGDFLKALSQLSFSTDKRWTANTTKNPNVAVLLEILEDYKKAEHRPSRAKVLGPLLEYAIGLYASDLFYVERGEWFLFQLAKNMHRFQFHESFVNPDHWYPKERYAGIDEEALDAPTIEEEYVKWYGVDPTKDECVISYDMTHKEELIRLQIEWYQKNVLDAEEWAKAELEKI